MGWIGNQRQLLYALSVVNADRDENGNFIVTGTPVSSFMGLDDENNDVVVPDETNYLAGGQACKVAGLLNSTSYRERT